MKTKFKFSSKFPHKRAFVTGAGSGFGQQFALDLAGDGWHLGLTDLNASALETTARLVAGAGGSSETFAFDVSDESAYQQAAHSFLRNNGGIDLLINNAGVGDSGRVGDYSLTNWRWLLDINLLGVIHGCHFFIPQMRKQQSGHIINIASAAAFASMPTMAAYNVSKAGVVALSETISCELAHHKVGVTAVMPEFVRTNIMQHSRNRDADLDEMARLYVNTSGLTPQMVVPMILQKAARGTHSIVFPARAKLVRALSRFAPGFWRFVRRYMHRNQAKVLATLQKAEAKQA